MARQVRAPERRGPERQGSGRRGPAAHDYAQSQAMFEAAKAVIPGGINSSFRANGDPCPLFFARGEGSRLIDVDGNVYIDYALGMGPCILGHAHPEVIAAVTASLAGGQLFAGQHPGEVELAKRIQSLVPSAERVRFASSGTEAVQAALRIVRAATGRSLVVKFEGHYHGWLDNIFLSVSPPADDPAEAGPQTPYRQSAGQMEAPGRDVAVLPWNDATAVRNFLDAHPGEVAAIIMEPILCNTGVLVPQAGYLERVRSLCDQHGALLIFDEVITGFRAHLGGAQARLGVTPDLTILAKALGAGFPIAAVAGRRRVMDALLDPRLVLGGTYNANTTAVAAANAALGILARDNGAGFAAMERQGERLMEGLRRVGRDTNLGLHVQGLGTVFNTCFDPPAPIVDYRSYRRANAEKQRAFVILLQHQGVRLTSRGTWFLSLVHGDDEIDRTIGAAQRALHALMSK